MYVDRLNKWFDENVARNWSELRAETMKLLQEEAELNEIVQLVGVDSLSVDDRLKLEATRSIREDYLHQNAFHEVDTYTSLEKQYKLLTLILKYYEDGLAALKDGADFKALSDLAVRERIGRFKYTEEKDIAGVYEDIRKQIETEMSALVASREVE
ncbi:V-type ATP synthase alpha chain [anaerobic digester metagenome]